MSEQQNPEKSQISAVEKIDAPVNDIELDLNEDGPDALDAAYRKKGADYDQNALTRAVAFGKDAGINVA